MTRIPDISLIKVIPKEPGIAPFSFRCLGGQAKWVRALGTVTLTANLMVEDHLAAESALEFLRSDQSCFDFEVGFFRGMPREELIVTRFFHCTQKEFEVQDRSVRPNGPTPMRLSMTIRSEQCVPPGR